MKPRTVRQLARAAKARTNSRMDAVAVRMGLYRLGDDPGLKKRLRSWRKWCRDRTRYLRMVERTARCR